MTERLTTSKTKSTTNPKETNTVTTFTTALKTANTEAAEAAQLSREKLETARANVDRFEELVDTTELALETLRGKLTSGDESVTSSQLAEAVATYDRAVLLDSGVQAAAKRAERALKTTSTELADVFASVVETTLPSVPVLTSAVAPQGVPSTKELPLALVVEKTSETGRDGSLSGEVDVLLYRAEIHRPLDGSQLTSTAAARNMTATTRSKPRSSDEEGVMIDRLLVKVEHAHAAVPVIRKLAEGNVSRLASNLAGEVAAVGKDENGVKMAKDRSFSSNRITSMPEGAKLVASSTGSKGKRVANIEARAHFQIHAPKYSSSSNARELSMGPRASLDGQVPTLAENYIGRFLPGLGVVTEAKLNVSAATKDQNLAALKLTLVSSEA